eukprot:TRINITY_DN95146_c0_g1_i1.p1 TRINITY_DN95146_c0_g1~~TRINITY_DN95146_c0_g1_i1.p1  ORF type:complete len:221 (+),score=30.45 TRINITY_DN95146_c0_g1_i1:28-663(+)
MSESWHSGLKTLASPQKRLHLNAQSRPQDGFTVAHDAPRVDIGDKTQEQRHRARPSSNDGLLYHETNTESPQSARSGRRFEARSGFEKSQLESTPRSGGIKPASPEKYKTQAPADRKPADPTNSRRFQAMPTDHQGLLQVTEEAVDGASAFGRRFASKPEMTRKVTLPEQQPQTPEPVPKTQLKRFAASPEGKDTTKLRGPDHDKLRYYAK